MQSRTVVIALVSAGLGTGIGYAACGFIAQRDLRRITVEVGRPDGMWADFHVTAPSFAFPRFGAADSTEQARDASQLLAAIKIGMDNKYNLYQVWSTDRGTVLRLLTPGYAEETPVPVPQDRWLDNAARVNAALRMLLGLATQPENPVNLAAVFPLSRS
jgi:hypothetical protein